jgi:hypothetical protein
VAALIRGIMLVVWQREEAAGLGDDIGELRQAAADADDIEQVAVLTALGIALMCS